MNELARFGHTVSCETDLAITSSLPTSNIVDVIPTVYPLPPTTITVLEAHSLALGSCRSCSGSCHHDTIICFRCALDKPSWLTHLCDGYRMYVFLDNNKPNASPSSLNTAYFCTPDTTDPLYTLTGQLCEREPMELRVSYIDFTAISDIPERVPYREQHHSTSLRILRAAIAPSL